MPGYIVLAEAKQDLQEIRRYTIQNWGKKQADLYIGELHAVFRLLSANPLAGRDRSEDLPAGYMSFVHSYHVIYYKKMGDRVAIAAILHHSRPPQKHIPQRGTGGWDEEPGGE